MKTTSPAGRPVTSPLPVRLTRQGRLLVAVPRTEPGSLRVETVERTRRVLRRERGRRA